jgi:hypothetical protein
VLHGEERRGDVVAEVIDVLSSTGYANGAWYLDADAGLAPMSPFGVVSVIICQYSALVPFIPRP